MKKVTVFLFALLFVLCGAASGRPAPAKRAAARDASTVAVIPLYKLAPVKAVDMNCVNSDYNIQVPLPERWSVKRAVLTFSYASSTNLIPEISQLVVKVNGYPVGQRKYNPMSPEARMTVPIPVELLSSGYNTVSFQVVQHYMKECERPCSPDLWTTINLDKAHLEIEYTLKPVPLRLSDISTFLFDPRISPNGEVNMITEKTSSDIITTAGIMASGIARRFDYKKVIFTVTPDVKAGVDNVLVGGKKFVDGFLRARGVHPPDIAGPYIRIMRLPAASGGYDPAHALLVVSGQNEDEVRLAAETVTNMTAPFPQTDEMSAVGFSLPEIPRYGGRIVLTADKRYDFKTLNFPTTTFEGFAPTPMDIVFRLPVDFYIKQNQYAELKLNFVYGAGMRPDSVLNVTLNGKTVRAIQMKNGGGDLIEGYLVNIPTYLFKPGTNKLSFIPAMSPVARDCDLIHTKNLFITVFDNSTFYFPQMPHFIELPAIDLFMINGFPFTRWPDGFESAIYLPGADERSIAAAMNLIGFISQRNGYPVFGMKITTEKPKSPDSELIVIGAAASIPDEIKNAAPLKLVKPSTVPYPVIRNWEGESSFAYSKQSSGIGGGMGILMEYQSPYKNGRTALVLTGATTEDVLALSESLLEPDVNGQTKGDLVLVDLTKRPDYNVSAYAVGKRYTTGEAGVGSRLDYYLFSHPHLYQVAIALAVAFIGVAVFLMLRKFRKGRINGADEDKR